MTRPAVSLRLPALRLVSLALGVVLVLILVPACGSERPGAVPSGVDPALRSAGASPVPAGAGTAARPTWVLVQAARRKRFLASLKAIDRDLVVDRDRALSRAVDTCYLVYDGKPNDAVRAYARTVYGGGTVELTTAAAARIVAKIKKWICSSGTLHRRWES